MDHDIDPPVGVEDHVVRSGIEPRSNTVLVFAGDMEWSRGEALALNVAGEMLGIRLREVVREQLGGTYSIWVNASASTLQTPSTWSKSFSAATPHALKSCSRR